MIKFNILWTTVAFSNTRTRTLHASIHTHEKLFSFIFGRRLSVVVSRVCFNSEIMQALLKRARSEYFSHFACAQVSVSYFCAAGGLSPSILLRRTRAARTNESCSSFLWTLGPSPWKPTWLLCCLPVSCVKQKQRKLWWLWSPDLVGKM